MIDIVYDACVLYSASLRDLLLNLADKNVVHAHWSDDIHREWIESLLRNRPQLKRESLERTRRAMDEAIKGSLVKGYEFLIPTLQLPDPDDRHVLAVAICVKATWIVTYNLSDFPKTNLLPYGVEAISPDEFVSRLIVIKPNEVLAAARAHRRNLKNPPKTVDEYLETLRKQKLVKTVTFLEQHRNEI